MRTVRRKRNPRRLGKFGGMIPLAMSLLRLWNFGPVMRATVMTSQILVFVQSCSLNSILSFASLTVLLFLYNHVASTLYSHSLPLLSSDALYHVLQTGLLNQLGLSPDGHKFHLMT